MRAPLLPPLAILAALSIAPRPAAGLGNGKSKGHGTTRGAATTTGTAAVPPSNVTTLSRTWTACGGPGPASLVCASVRVSVTGTHTTVQVANISGMPLPALGGERSVGQWVLTTVGFDGIPAATGTFTTGVTTTSGPWWERTSSTAAPASWQRFDDKQFGGGVNVDFGLDNGNGISGGIASSCAPAGSLPGGANRLWMTPVLGCGGYAIADQMVNAGWFTAGFTTASSWDPNLDKVALYFKAQNGPGGASYECLLGGADPREECQPVAYDYGGDAGYSPDAVVPEPRTFVLMATGLLALLVPAARRKLSRRRD